MHHKLFGGQAKVRFYIWGGGTKATHKRQVIKWKQTANVEEKYKNIHFSTTVQVRPTQPAYSNAYRTIHANDTVPQKFTYVLYVNE